MDSRPTRKTDFVIHDYDHRISQTWNLIKKELSKENVALIQKHDDVLINQALAKATRLKHLQILLNLTRLLDKRWSDVNVDDVNKMVTHIMKTYGSDNGQETNTTWDHKKVLKIFFRWLKLGSRDYREVGDPPETKHVKLRKVKDKIVREDLLTKDDITRLVQACSGNLRDKAFIDCHYEAGTRPSEILNLKIKHVKFDKLGAVLHVDGKTGPRTIRLVTSTPNLAKWIDNHPFKDNPEAPLWIVFEKENFGNPLTYAGARKLLSRACWRANITKHVNLNLFRHSEATNTAKFMTEAQMRNRHGWTPYSKMPSRYVHLINADVDEAIFDHYGIKTKEIVEEKNLPKVCKICQMPNSHDVKVCSRCSKPLDLETAISLEEKEHSEKEEMRKEISNIREEFQKKIEEIKYGPDGRVSRYGNALFQAGENGGAQMLIKSLALILELLFSEKKKRLLWKEIDRAKEKNDSPDVFSALGISDLSESDKISMLERLMNMQKQSIKTNAPRINIERIKKDLVAH